ncbi:hypothetical protein CONPUDRAFT_144627 [Coniophora puteana RWD-64-598 SS2]|uniref:F-box domain-containing protein n=1 Tax=Coniophora puteana (strain RWD-64-598) TaxID=741705 RepID=A0A5M3MN48_CONPW|nr:uncharacterized protein CONPUDRAFT_144627 [Coniophora puteana RWD-64-598 SS2]EIW80598.1 hypothetical protein CONPUDRAFT_144627 [Coniophora puteana RWD-64-598 SS2]
MHRCLRLIEVVAIICQDLDDKKSLAWLAQVSQNLKEPALDALYADIENIVDLLRSFPSHVLSLEEHPPNKPILLARQQPARADRDKVLSYTSRVRCLNEQVFGSESAVPPPETADAMCEWIRPTSFLFPKLRKVCISLQHVGYYHFVTTFITGPSLLHLELDECYKPLLFRCAPNLASMCPSLETLIITCDIHQTDDEDNVNIHIPAALENLRGWPNLRSINYGPLDCDSLVYLSRLPTLRSLTIPVTRYSSWINSPTCGYFGSLDHLTLKVADYQVGVIAVMKLFSRSDGLRARLRSLRLHVLMCQSDEVLLSTPSPLAPITAALATYLCRTTLKEFFVSQHNSPDVGIATAFIDHFQSLFPLTSFTALTHLTTRDYGNGWGDTFQLTESKLLELLRHWPALEIIDCATQSISLSGIIAILRLCPRIRSVMVSATFCLDDVLEYLFGEEWSPGMPLTFIDIPCHNTSLTDAKLKFQPHDVVSPGAVQTVAIFFSRVAPNLAPSVRCGSLAYTVQQDFWDAVYAVMAPLRSGLWDGFHNALLPLTQTLYLRFCCCKRCHNFEECLMTNLRCSRCL